MQTEQTNGQASGPAWSSIDSREMLGEFLHEEGGAAIIDMWAPWCGPCKAMAPHFEAAAEHYRDEPISFYKINTEANPELGRMFNVRSIPTTLLILDGEVVDIVIGAMDGHKIGKRVEWLLSKSRGEGFFTRVFGLGKKK